MPVFSEQALSTYRQKAGFNTAFIDYPCAYNASSRFVCSDTEFFWKLLNIEEFI